MTPAKRRWHDAASKGNGGRKAGSVLWRYLQRPLDGAFVILNGLVFLLAAALIGCGTNNPHPPGTFEYGEYLNAKGKHHEAVDALDGFIRRNPADSLAAQAQYLKGLSYMELKEYPLAAVEFRILRKDHPTSALIEDAFYQEGLAYLMQVGRVERDISGALEARAHFRRFLNLYPESSFAAPVREKLQEISDMVVRKQLGAVDVYRHLGRREAAARVLDSIISEETESKLLDKVLLLRAEIALELDQKDVAERNYRRLLEAYPESQYAPTAQAGLKKATGSDAS